MAFNAAVVTPSPTRLSSRSQSYEFFETKDPHWFSEDAFDMNNEFNLFNTTLTSCVRSVCL